MTSASASRSARGFSAMVRRPVLGVGLIEPAPTKEATPATAGSRWTTSAACVCSALMRRDRDALRRLGHGDDDAGVLLRQEALGDDDVERDRADQRAERHQQDQALVAQRHDRLRR